jgi:dienelactone hydrolase
MMERALALALVVELVAGCVTAAPTPDALQPILRPHDTLYRPDGAGPFPAVVVLHGCSGVRGKDRRWAERLRDQGYVALVVDSLTGRGLTTRGHWREVCSGWTLWGGTRAADVRASLAYLRTLPYVDGEHLAVVGFSHGAWAALDLLAGASEDDVRGLRAVVAFYPYCGMASRAHWLGFRVRVPTLVLLGADDWKTSADECRDVATREAASGRPVTVTVYPGVGHSFDWRSSPATDDANRRVRAFLAENLGARRTEAGGTPERPTP